MTPKSTTHSRSGTTSQQPDRQVPIRAEPIELCQLLKFAGLAESGGDAKHLISQGKVSLNGAVETQKRKKVRSGDRVTFGLETIVVTLG